MKFDVKKFNVHNVKKIAPVSSLIAKQEKPEKPIVQYGTDGNPIKVFKGLESATNSIAYARKEREKVTFRNGKEKIKFFNNVRSGINSATKGRTVKKDGTTSYYAYGYQWRFFEEVKEDK